MQLRPYQSEAVDATWRWLTSERGSPVIVLPTGAGKSLVIAKLCQDATERFRGRVIVLAHRKELLEQNADKVRRLLPGHEIGLFSAGLRRWNADADIVVAGIQSCYDKSGNFGSRQLVIVDECHLIPVRDEGMYRTFLNDLRQLNPNVRVVGLTATPFRTAEGELCRPDAIFQRVCYEVPIQRLIREGYLAPVTSTPSETEVDTARIKIRGGEFVSAEVELAFDQTSVTKRACAEIVSKCGRRTSVLVFAAGVIHAGHVAAELERLTGETCGVVTGQSLALERVSLLERFRNRKLRWLVNVDVLTTGFDAPNIDAIAILRATCSPGLFAQICGRGFRRCEGKQDCLVLDFGGNIKRHGPLDDPEYGKPQIRRGDGVIAGEAPLKRCPNCDQELLLQSRECECGFLFPSTVNPRHEATAEQEAALLAEQAKPSTWIVEVVMMRAWENKKTGSRTLRVDYECQPSDKPTGNLTSEVISEWVCLEHDGIAGAKAQAWWRRRCLEPATCIEDAVELWNAGAVASPRTITARKDGRWWRVLDYELDEVPPRETWEHNLGTAHGVDPFATTVEEPF